VVESGAEVGAVDGGDRAGAADVGRDLAVAGFDLIAKDMPLVVDLAIGTGFEVQE
jgi:hypothetical protein